jgi:hypothetical protein
MALFCVHKCVHKVWGKQGSFQQSVFKENTGPLQAMVLRSTNGGLNWNIEPARFHWEGQSTYLTNVILLFQSGYKIFNQHFLRFLSPGLPYHSTDAG